jgi:formamidase
MHNRWHPDLEPIAEIEPGEEIRLECEEGLGGQFTRESTHEDVANADRGLGHPLTGPVYVKGAEPGQVLEVELLAYESDEFGSTALIPGFGFLADLFPDPYLVKWEIADGVARSEELPGVAVPEELFAGVIGVAPSHERMEAFRRREEQLRARGQLVADSLPDSATPAEAAGGLRTIPPRELGGNMDTRQLVAGSRLWLPVDVPGALFSIGDLHFAQGDGEVCGTAIEVAGAVTVRFALHDGPAPRLPRFECPSIPDPPRYGTMGIPVDEGMDVDAAARAALLGMLDHLEHRYGFEWPAAYALASVAVDLRISEVVDVPYPLVSALLRLDVFEMRR